MKRSSDGTEENIRVQQIYSSRMSRSNSVVYVRPYLLVPKQEGRDLMREILQGGNGVPGLEEEIRTIRESGLEFTLPPPDSNTVQATLIADPVMSAQDDKMKKCILGIEGAYCTICSFSDQSSSGW